MALKIPHAVDWSSFREERPARSVYQSRLLGSVIVTPATCMHGSWRTPYCALAGLCVLAGSIGHGNDRRVPLQRRLCPVLCKGSPTTCRAENDGQGTSKPTVGLFILAGLPYLPECIVPIFKAVQEKGIIEHAVIVVDEVHKHRFESAEIMSLGVDLFVAPPVSGGAFAAFNDAVQSSTSTQAVALFPCTNNQAESFALAQDRGQRAWSIRARQAYYEANDVLYSCWFDDTVEFIPPLHAKPREPCQKAVVLEACGTKGALMDRQASAVRLQQDLSGLKEAFDKVVEALTDLGYLPADSLVYPWRLRAAVAKFAFVNDLGATPVFPLEDGVAHVHEQLRRRPSQDWKPDPGDLVFFCPVRKGGKKKAAFRGLTSAMATSMAGGGPFIAKISPDLVRDVLLRMEYIQEDESLCEEAIALFYESGPNRSTLAKAGISASRAPLETELHEAFSSQDIFQDYRCAPLDTPARNFLSRLGQTSLESAEKNELKEKMRDFLTEKYPNEILPVLYAGLVRRMVTHINPT